MGQKGVRLKRNQNINFQKGTNWFSITDSLARYVVSQAEWVYDVFKDSFCGDELFLQTLVVNSEYKNNLYYEENSTKPSCMRYIDWSTGRVHVFCSEDIDALSKSDLLFARKFDCNVDSNVIQMVYNLYKW